MVQDFVHQQYVRLRAKFPRLPQKHVAKVAESVVLDSFSGAASEAASKQKREALIPLSPGHQIVAWVGGTKSSCYLRRILLPYYTQTSRKLSCGVQVV